MHIYIHIYVYTYIYNHTHTYVCKFMYAWCHAYERVTSHTRFALLVSTEIAPIKSTRTFSLLWLYTSIPTPTRTYFYMYTHIYTYRQTNRQTHTYISPCDEFVWTEMAPTVATRTHILPWLYRHTHAHMQTHIHALYTHTLSLSLTHTCTSPCVVLVLTVVAPTEATRFHASIANSYPETHMNESCSLRKFISWNTYEWAM